MDFHRLSLSLSPFPFPNETPRRLPVHELQGVVSQSRLKKMWCIRSLPEFLYPIQLSANYLMHLVFFFSFQPSVYSLSIDWTLFHFCFKAS